MPTHKLDTGQFAPWSHLHTEFFMHIGNLLAELEAAYKEADVWRGTEHEREGILVDRFSFITRDLRLTPDSGNPYVPNRKILQLEDKILWDLFEYKRKFRTE
jgi:hypothetical protein